MSIFILKGCIVGKENSTNKFREIVLFFVLIILYYAIIFIANLFFEEMIELKTKIINGIMSLIFKVVKAKGGYIVSIPGGYGFYIESEKQVKELEIGTGPVKDMMLTAIEYAVDRNNIPVKYQCSKCKSIVDNESDLTIYGGGLGKFCNNCIEQMDSEE